MKNNFIIPKAIPTANDIIAHNRLTSIIGTMVTVNIRNDITISTDDGTKSGVTIDCKDQIIYGKVVHAEMHRSAMDVKHYLYIMAFPPYDDGSRYINTVVDDNGNEIQYTHIIDCSVDKVKARGKNGRDIRRDINSFINNTNGKSSKKRVIAAFPGMGKSTAAKLYPELFKDMESSEYHWIEDLSGKYKNPEWPHNYIDAIFEEAYDYKDGEPKYILISTHKEVLDEIARLGYSFDVIIPKTSEYVKALYEKRGSSPEFISSVIGNFDNYINDVKNSNATRILQADHYLCDIVMLTDNG